MRRCRCWPSDRLVLCPGGGRSVIHRQVVGSGDLILIAMAAGGGGGSRFFGRAGIVNGSCGSLPTAVGWGGGGGFCGGSSWDVSQSSSSYMGGLLPGWGAETPFDSNSGARMPPNTNSRLYEPGIAVGNGCWTRGGNGLVKIEWNGPAPTMTPTVSLTSAATLSSTAQPSSSPTSSVSAGATISSTASVTKSPFCRLSDWNFISYRDC